jgi:tetratricopeptide (TPR) repeat protein
MTAGPASALIERRYRRGSAANLTSFVFTIILTGVKNGRMRVGFAVAICAMLLAGIPAGAQAPAPQRPSRQSTPPAQQAELAQLAAQASAALRQGDFATAIQGFERLTKLAPGIAEFHADLGMAYYSGGRFRDALAPCRQALKLKPTLTAARYFLGLSLAESGQCREALAYLEKDYPRIPDPQLKHVMGTNALRCAMALGQSDKAIDFVRWLSRDFPDDPDVLYLSTHVHSELSTRASQRLLRTAPSSYQAHQLNAEVKELQGKEREAIEEYRKVLAAHPQLTGIHYRLGRLLLAGPEGPSRLDEARREFEQELRLDTGNAGAEYELGEMARRARQWNDAIEHFRHAAQLDPEFVEALIGLGKALVSAGRAPEALAPLEAAAKHSPDNPVAHYQLSFAYRRLGREEEAKKEFAAYQAAHEKRRSTEEAITGGIFGRATAPQTAEPPE